jgi:hypothetical protein
MKNAGNQEKLKERNAHARADVSLARLHPAAGSENRSQLVQASPGWGGAYTVPREFSRIHPRGSGFLRVLEAFGEFWTPNKMKLGDFN